MAHNAYIIEEKISIRERIRKKVLPLLSCERKAAAERLCHKTLRAIPEVSTADIVLAYMALPSEIDILSLCTTLLQEGKVVAIPRVKEPPCMDFYILSSCLEEAAFERGAFGIREPKMEQERLFVPEAVPSQTNVCVLTPGLAFTTDGKRLGRGKGFYDAYLSRLLDVARAQAFCVYTIGICFEEQIVDDIPQNEHDVTLNRVVWA